MNGDPQTNSIRFTESPAVFVCEPPICAGRLEIASVSGEALKVKRLGIEEVELKNRNGQILDAFSIFAKLAPHESRQIEILIELHPQTPPGLYRGVFVIGSERKPFEINVLQAPRLLIEPGRVSLRGTAGQTVRFPVVLHNDGNVPHALRKAAFAIFRETDGFHRALFNALTQGDHPQGYESTLNELCEQVRKAEVNPAVVRIHAEHSGQVDPGERLKAEFEMDLPGTLTKDRLYTGSIRLERAKLSFNLFCDRTQNQDAERSSSEL